MLERLSLEEFDPNKFDLIGKITGSVYWGSKEDEEIERLANEQAPVGATHYLATDKRCVRSLGKQRINVDVKYFNQKQT